MANTKVTGLGELAATPATTDLLNIVDVSDTTMNASGTNKKIQAKYFLTTNGTANTLSDHIAGNSKNITDLGTITCTLLGETWNAVTFNTGWSNLGGAWHGVKYKKAGDLVFLRGLAQRTSGSETTIFTLPVGYRASLAYLFTAYSSTGIASIEITNAGLVKLNSGGTAYVSLDGIVFSTSL